MARPEKCSIAFRRCTVCRLVVHKTKEYLKIYFLIVILISLSGCIQSTALLGPGVTIATTGNIMQAGFQYGANTAIKKETGKDVIAHLKDVVEEEQENKKLELTIKNIATNTIEKVKKKLSIN